MFFSFFFIVLIGKSDGFWMYLLLEIVKISLVFFFTFPAICFFSLCVIGEMDVSRCDGERIHSLRY
jgi:hypothetical protein